MTTVDTPSLFDTLDEPAPTADTRDLDAAFAAHHAAHPEVYAALVRLARQARSRGHDRIGIGMLWEVLRWETTIGDPAGDYRLNNDHRSRYARLIMDQEPDLAGVFEVRELRP
jgi:hypothetical protein